VTAALAVRARRVKLLKVISTLWCREKWLFALVGGFVALLGHGLLRLLIALGCAAGIANVLQAVTTLQLNFVANGRLTWRRRVAGSGVGLWQRWGRFHLARGRSFSARSRVRPRHAVGRSRSSRRLRRLILGSVLPCSRSCSPPTSSSLPSRPS
jgi:hypothetical protein